MAISDKTLGYIGLTFSCSALVYLFFRLMIIPILPLSDDNPLNLSPPVGILIFCGSFGFIFIGTLLYYTFYILYWETEFETPFNRENFVVHRKRYASQK